MRGPNDIEEHPNSEGEASEPNQDGSQEPDEQAGDSGTPAAAEGTTVPLRSHKVVFCILDNKNRFQYAVAPLPDTYQELAIELLGRYINSPDVLASDIYLKYGIKRKARTDWAYLPPRFFSQIVCGNGEELRIYNKDGRQVDNDEEAKKGYVGSVVTFRLGDTARTPWGGVGGRHAVHTLPETYAETKEVALRGLKHFMKKKDATVADITLRAMIKNREGEWVAAELPAGQGWKDTVIGLIKKYQNLEILVSELHT
ncbi:hypothetical protein NLJ89_g5455 [Agrocybe chaxingu]|uniref:Uncharacterized protein n=1 Tax=Agrocybe chaxingu TaxID=84603 RepID=A0A9W8JYH7_9AGAR|nr:hypothetical protein NLJ89_g5455 [Agrocybe chaxingu]